MSEKFSDFTPGTLDSDGALVGVASLSSFPSNFRTSLANLKTSLNLAGSNQGDITLSGENYLSLAGQAITVNAVNLSGSNITGQLPATAIANGTISNTEFQYLNGVTSAIQTQLNALVPYTGASSDVDLGNHSLDLDTLNAESVNASNNLDVTNNITAGGIETDSIQLDSNSGLFLKSAGTHYMIVAISSITSSNKTLTLDLSNANRTITLKGNINSGTYTPTLTNVANLAASTAYQCQYMQVGDVVTVSGRVDIDPTLATTSTQLGISLPVASNLGAAEDCAGTAFASGIAAQGAAILGDATNNRAQLEYISSDTTNQAMYFTFTYQII